jgi:hypothetical protein
MINWPDASTGLAFYLFQSLYRLSEGFNFNPLNGMARHLKWLESGLKLATAERSRPK